MAIKVFGHFVILPVLMVNMMNYDIFVSLNKQYTRCTQILNFKAKMEKIRQIGNSKTSKGLMISLLMDDLPIIQVTLHIYQWYIVVQIRLIDWSHSGLVYLTIFCSTRSSINIFHRFSIFKFGSIRNKISENI